MSLPQINLVIIGHKDHGKSTLIGRLLYDSHAIPHQKLEEVEEELKKAGDEGFRFAFLLDTLEEERRGGLTIDIMHTPFQSQKYRYTIIDCPGHQEFIKKMLTGASQADAAVLVVSAHEGIQDQTKQHAFLIKALGITQLVVAVNKMDTVHYDEATFQEISTRLTQILTSLEYTNPPIVPVSALKGENVSKKSEKMPWFHGQSLLDTLDTTIRAPVPPLDKPLRGCVQDIYDRHGENLVVAKILTGTLEEGKAIRFDPSGETGIVTKIELVGGSVGSAGPGDSVGLVVSELGDVERGEIISYPANKTHIARSVVAEIILLSELQVRNGDVLTIRYGTAQSPWRVEQILERINPVNLEVVAESPEILKDGDVGKVRFAPLQPACVEEYAAFPELGRFVVEGKKGTEAAGIVLETEPQQ